MHDGGSSSPFDDCGFDGFFIFFLRTLLDIVAISVMCRCYDVKSSPFKRQRCGFRLLKLRRQSAQVLLVVSSLSSLGRRH